MRWSRPQIRPAWPAAKRRLATSSVAPALRSVRTLPASLRGSLVRPARQDRTYGRDHSVGERKRPVAKTRGANRVLEQHRDRHRADAAWNRRDERRALRRSRIDVADEPGVR